MAGYETTPEDIAAGRAAALARNRGNGSLPVAVPSGGGSELPPEVAQMIEQAMAGGSSPPMGAGSGATAMANSLPTITPGGDQGIRQMLMQFLTAPGSPIGKLLNPDPGFGIAGPGGPGLPPPNLMGAMSGGGPPGATPDPSQVRSVPGASVVRAMRDPTRLASDAMAGFGGGRTAIGPGPGGAAMGSADDIANAIRAMTAAGGDGVGDGVPADGDIVDPNRGRLPGAKAPLGKSYGAKKIKRGQTLSGIAGGDINRQRMIQAANPNIRDPNKIRAGDTINVPVTNVTRAKSSGKKSKKAMGSKQDIQRRAVSQAKEQSGYDRQKKKNKQSASKIQARRNLASGGRY